MKINKKVILIGYFGVGKTSLVQRFVHKSFSDEYLTTIGVKIEKKEIELDGSELNMMIWDLAGETSSVKTPESYKKGSHGVIYVFDVTRPVTYQNLQNELLNIDMVLPNVPIYIVGNKSDLIDEKSINDIQEELGLKKMCFTSALNNENVEELFLDLARKLVDEHK